MSFKLIQISLFADAFQRAAKMVCVASNVSFNNYPYEKEGTRKPYYDESRIFSTP
jgi:hypothetical protein